MKIETINFDRNMANTYVVSHNHQAIIIDPANSINEIEQAVGTNKVVGIILTHGHYDHFKTLPDVLNKYQVPLFMHKNAYHKLSNPEYSYSYFFGNEDGIEIDDEKVSFVKDNDTLNIGNFSIKVWLTKGHTDCSICLFIDNHLFSGDTLFRGTVGRTDLESSNTYELVESIKRLMNLKKDYLVYPGHGLHTSIEAEKRLNFFYNQIKH